MHRRRFLAIGCTVLPVGFAGCSTDSGQETGARSTATGAGSTTSSGQTRSRTGFDPAEVIAIEVSNGRDDPVTVTLSLTHDGGQLFDRTLELDPGERRTVDPGIEELGDYELRVSLADGTERVRPFDVEAYDRRMGSNLIVTIGDTIRVPMEE